VPFVCCFRLWFTNHRYLLGLGTVGSLYDGMYYTAWEYVEFFTPPCHPLQHVPWFLAHVCTTVYMLATLSCSLAQYYKQASQLLCSLSGRGGVGEGVYCTCLPSWVWGVGQLVRTHACAPVESSQHVNTVGPQNRGSPSIVPLWHKPDRPKHGQLCGRGSLDVIGRTPRSRRWSRSGTTLLETNNVHFLGKNGTSPVLCRDLAAIIDYRWWKKKDGSRRDIGAVS
jgi:hypothetical protein